MFLSTTSAQHPRGESSIAKAILHRSNNANRRPAGEEQVGAAAEDGGLQTGEEKDGGLQTGAAAKEGGLQTEQKDGGLQTGAPAKEGGLQAPAKEEDEATPTTGGEQTGQRTSVWDHPLLLRIRLPFAEDAGASELGADEHSARSVGRVARSFVLGASISALAILVISGLARLFLWCFRKHVWSERNRNRDERISALEVVSGSDVDEGVGYS